MLSLHDVDERMVPEAAPVILVAEYDVVSFVQVVEEVADAGVEVSVQVISVENDIPLEDPLTGAAMLVPLIGGVAEDADVLVLAGPVEAVEFAGYGPVDVVMIAEVVPPVTRDKLRLGEAAVGPPDAVEFVGKGAAVDVLPLMAAVRLVPAADGRGVSDVNVTPPELPGTEDAGYGAVDVLGPVRDAAVVEFKELEDSVDEVAAGVVPDETVAEARPVVEFKNGAEGDATGVL
ncbi:hypothetical protein NKR23_g1613 [Pleurostoma richardsiae]|uniref:Uncharacterized protein n=1 Tax=Pleurostoma richardsiae TaxID=41990 RepID=A0AA38VVY7_9PEZI|nr:hypothetical protein NKR23_g1613 [Pleurostoma richardsiae]